VYICLDTPERSIQRVRERVAQGGHDVPDTDVRRRYIRSLLNLPAALSLAHQAMVYDNSEAEPRKVLETQTAQSYGALIANLHGLPMHWKRPLCLNSLRSQTANNRQAGVRAAGGGGSGATVRLFGARW
jgi:hypothetical protein